MGNFISQGKSNFKICKGNFPDLIETATEKYPELFDSLSSIREIFKEFGFFVECDSEGNLYQIEWIRSYTRDEEVLFRLVAPFVSAGSFVSFSEADGGFLRYNFDGVNCETVRPLLIWPEFPDDSGEERNPRKTNLDEIKGRYPAEKPFSFNYMQAREDVFTLCKAIEGQTQQLQELKIRMAAPSER